MQRPDIYIATTMSSTAHGFSSEKAIDGQYGPDPESCNCCSETLNSPMSWWRVDLTAVYSISEIIIYGRHDGITILENLVNIYDANLNNNCNYKCTENS